MSVIATIEVPADAFTLGEAMSKNPGIRVQFERAIPLGETFIPYLWAEDDAVQHIESALAEEADIESFTVLDSVDGQALVRVEWAEDVDGLLKAIADTGGVIFEAYGDADVWTFYLRFAEHDDLAEFHRRCARHGIPVELRSVYNPGFSRHTGIVTGLTDTQRETLEAALEAGHFEVPRETNLSELAEQLGVSDTAVSQRLRRGISALVTETLARSDEKDTP